MSRFIIQEKIDTPADLKSFALDGYGYDEEQSGGDTLVFTRLESARK